MSSFASNQGLVLVREMIRTIRKNKQYLSDIDGEIGDGDHGINMNKGFSLCKQRMRGTENLSGGLELLGHILFAEIGGSTGPLYGNFFLEMAKACASKEQVDAALFSAMLRAGQRAIEELGEAKIGDKTLMDTLIPAIEAFDTAMAAGGDLSDCLEAMTRAAEKGKDSTKDLVAKIGRASRLGERSRGVPDAGASSCYLLLQAMAKGADSLL